MALVSIVIECDASDEIVAQTAVNDAIAAVPITPSQFIQAVTIAPQEPNVIAVIIIFYDNEA